MQLSDLINHGVFLRLESRSVRASQCVLLEERSGGATRADVSTCWLGAVTVWLVTSPLEVASELIRGAQAVFKEDRDTSPSFSVASIRTRKFFVVGASLHSVEYVAVALVSAHRCH